MNYNVVDPGLEITDPIPNIYELFQNFNYMFFESRLQSVTVDWSNTMKYAAGVCSYSPRDKFCQIQLSTPLLKLRPRKDLVETLLHEMIHAYLFVTENDTDRNGHGANFKGIMKRINTKTGANITVYHDFHDEVNHYKTNWYRCNGPCQHLAPLFGFVKGKLDRGPCNKDRWYAKHKAKCGGIFHKSLVAPSKSLISKEINSSKKSSKTNQNNQTKLFSNNGQLDLLKTNRENEVSSSINSKNLIKKITDFVPFSGVGKVLGHSSSFTEKSRTVGLNSNLKRKIISANLNNKENVRVVEKEVSSETIEPIKKKPFMEYNQEQSDLDRTKEFSIGISSKDKEEQSDMEKAIQLSLMELNQCSNNQNTVESNTFVECPSCPNIFLLSEINEHLNQCLS